MIMACGFCFRHSKRSVLLLCFSVVVIYLVVHFILKSPRFKQFQVRKFRHPRFGKILNLEAWRNVTERRQTPEVKSRLWQRMHQLAAPRPPADDARLVQRDKEVQLLKHGVKSSLWENERKAELLKQNEKDKHLQRKVHQGDFRNDRKFETFKRNVKPQPLQDDTKFKAPRPRDEGKLKYMQDAVDSNAMQYDPKFKALRHEVKPKAFQDDVNPKAFHDDTNPKASQHNVKPKPFGDKGDEARFQPLQRKVKSRTIQGDVKLKALQSDSRFQNLPPNAQSEAVHTNRKDKASKTVLRSEAFPGGEHPKTSQDKANSKGFRTALKSKTLRSDVQSKALPHGWETIVEKLWARKVKNKIQQDDIHPGFIQGDTKLKHWQDGVDPKTAHNRLKPQRISDTDENNPGALKFQPRVEASGKGGYGNMGKKKDLVFPGKAGPSPPQFQQSAQHEARTSQQKLDDYASKSMTHQKLKAGQKSGPADHFASSGGSHKNCGDYDFHTRDPQLQAFKPAVRGKDLCILRSTLTALSETLMKAGIPFFLTGGSLLGSWRHHNIVPWDDRVEIAIDHQLQKHLQNAGNSLKPGYRYEPRSGRFYSVSASPRPGVSWRWPFVSIQFFGQNTTHVFNQDAGPNPRFLFPSDWIFPLIRRPFLGLSMPCPYQSRRVVEHLYSVHKCEVRRSAHGLKEVKGVSSVPCNRLKAVYPFVQHMPLRDRSACLESAVKNGTVINQMLFENVPC